MRLLVLLDLNKKYPLSKWGRKGEIKMIFDQITSTAIPGVAGPLLELKNVTKQFGGLKAVEDVTFRVYPGQIVSIIGPNGAGKTTVFNLITGIYRPTSGDIRLAGQSLVGLSPDKIVLRGLART